MSSLKAMRTPHTMSISVFMYSFLVCRQKGINGIIWLNFGLNKEDDVRIFMMDLSLKL